jgi:hypothetical protein
VKSFAPFEMTDGLRSPYLHRQTQESSLTPEGVSYRSEDGAIGAKPRTHTGERHVRQAKKPREERFLTAQTPFGMTKFFRQLASAHCGFR